MARNPKQKQNCAKLYLRLLDGELNNSPSQLSDIPANFRILVTSRPLEDIHDVLDTVSHVRRVSMDYISPVSTERDIHFTSPPGWRERAVYSIMGTLKRSLRNLKACLMGSSRLQKYELSVPRSNRPKLRLLDHLEKGHVYARSISAEFMPEDERGEDISVCRSVMGIVRTALRAYIDRHVTAFFTRG